MEGRRAGSQCCVALQDTTLMCRAQPSRPCEREGRSQGAPGPTFRLHLIRGQAPAVLEENMVKLAETWLTEPGVD